MPAYPAQGAAHDRPADAAGARQRPAALPPAGLQTLSIIPGYNALLGLLGVCTVTGRRTTGAPFVNCYDFSGNPPPTPP